MSEILNCPFCDGKAEANWNFCLETVECTNCSAEIWAETLAEAITAWNRRSQSSEAKGWMPIETAPTEFPPHRVLLWGPNIGMHIGTALRYEDGDVLVNVGHIAGNTRDLITHWRPPLDVPQQKEKTE